MTNEDYSKVPPPHLLKKFSEQARVDSQKRGHPGYCKTFAKLCINWAFQEAAMDDLRVASAEVSGVELNSKSSPNNPQIRSSDLDVTIALVQRWTDEVYGGTGAFASSDDVCLAALAAKWGADQELDACCEWVSQWRCMVGGSRPEVGLRAARRPKPATLKEQSLKHLEVMERDGHYLPEILQDLRRAVEQLDD
jgi:hypothetical protein